MCSDVNEGSHVIPMLEYACPAVVISSAVQYVAVGAHRQSRAHPFYRRKTYGNSICDSEFDGQRVL